MRRRVNLAERSEVGAGAGEAGGLNRAANDNGCSEPLVDARERNVEAGSEASRSAERNGVRSDAGRDERDVAGAIVRRTRSRRRMRSRGPRRPSGSISRNEPGADRFRWLTAPLRALEEG